MTTKVESIHSDVRQFLIDNFILEDSLADLGADDSLTQLGILDSMGVLELIMFLEDRFGLSVPDEDTVPENLDSIARISAYVSNRLSKEAQRNG